MPAYYRPERCADAFRLLADRRLTVLAGGTDHYPARVGQARADDILDVSALRDLRGIAREAARWRIGAGTTWSDVIETQLPPLFDGLKLAAREVGGLQIQNAGTVAGNLCNASPAADGVPPLLALDAAVELSSTAGVRTVPLHAFILGPRRTARRPDELLSAVLVPHPAHDARSHFAKLGARRYLVISIAMVAATIQHARGKVTSARVAVGACSPVARRLPALEDALAGARLDASLGSRAQAAHLEPLAPLDDVRADAAYRREAALILLQRTLSHLGSAA